MKAEAQRARIGTEGDEKNGGAEARRQSARIGTAAWLRRRVLDRMKSDEDGRIKWIESLKRLRSLKLH